MTPDPQKSSRGIVSGIMIAGTYVAMIVLAAAVIMLTLGSVHPDLRDYSSAQHSSPSPSAIMNGVIALDPSSIAMFGVIMILLIPVARTLGAAYIFIRERDRLFAALSLAIVISLLAGAWSHLARGAPDHADHPARDAAVPSM